MSFWTASRALYRTSWSSWCMWFITSCLPPSCSITLKDRQTERCRSRLLCSVRCSSTRRSGGFCISIELWEWCRTTAGVLRQCSAQSAPPGQSRNKMRKIMLLWQSDLISGWIWKDAGPLLRGGNRSHKWFRDKTWFSSKTFFKWIKNKISTFLQTV